MVNFSICFPSGALVPPTSNSRKSSNLWPTFSLCFSHTRYNNYENLFFLIKNLNKDKSKNLGTLDAFWASVIFCDAAFKYVT